MQKRTPVLLLLLVFFMDTAFSQNRVKKVPAGVMQQVYEEVKTPYKYGVVLAPAHDSLKLDCPTVFRKGRDWYMTYIQFDGRGYETWLAKSSDLLHWKMLGRLLSFSSDTTLWMLRKKPDIFRC